MHLFLLVLISVKVVVVVFATQEAVPLGTDAWSVAPPATFDGWTMTAITNEPREGHIMVSDVEALELDPSDPITFSRQVEIWGNEVPIYGVYDYFYPEIRGIEIFFPQDTCAFIFYVQPTAPDVRTYNIESTFGHIISQDILQSDGPFGFAVSYCLEHGQPLSVKITDSNPGEILSLGKFAISKCGPDTDGDSIPDLVDNCPNDANPGQCDYDGDGYGDVCDSCILGVNDADWDNDGVPDACDKCPGFDDSQDRDGDGIPDLCDFCPDDDNYVDTDGDGIPDCIDNCVHSPNADQADMDNDGIGDACENNDACCINDCSGVATGNYQSCVSCSVYVTCNWGKLIDNRPCPGSLYWDANIGGCVHESGTCDPNGQSTPCPSP